MTVRSPRLSDDLREAADQIARDPREPIALRLAARALLRAEADDALKAALDDFRAFSDDMSEAVVELLSHEGDKPRESEPVMEAKEEAVPESEARGGFRPTPIKPATSLEVIADEYIDMFLRMEVVPDRHRAIDIQRRKVVSGSASYKAVAAATAVPWAFIGIVHALEAGFDFSRHLHNGDPLNARTVQVPQGRPTSGQPPFAWEVSAEDALRGQGLDKVGTWTLPRFLYELERYNGFGYRFRSLPTPYLWSGSNQYERGKFVRDGVFDREAVSTQIGGAVLLRALGDAEDLAALPAI